MVNSISGTVTFKSSDHVGIETSGIEWSLETSTTTLSLLPVSGEKTRIYTYLHHSQDSMRLFGFATLEERRLFLALLTVNGVGVSLARKILSGTSPEKFIQALDSEDLAALGSIPGLGKKTAQKIVLHLRGKLAEESEITGGEETSDKDVVNALISMGFDGRKAAKAVSEIINSPDISSLSGEEREKEILRRAIIIMSS